MTRTVGQLVAEALKLYSSRFAVALVLGVPVAAMDQVYLTRVDTEALVDEVGRVATSDVGYRMAVYLAFAPLLTLAYALASHAATGEQERPPLRAWVTAVVAGTAVFVPAAVLLPTFAFLSIAWLGLVGLVVPVAMIERRSLGATFPRALVLGRADYVHAFGALATFAILFWVARNALVFLLREQAENTLRWAVLLGDLVLSPLLFLGAALLYADQAARVGTTRQERDEMRRAG